MTEYTVLHAILIMGGMGGLLCVYAFFQERWFQRMIEDERRQRENSHPAE
jgi:hypothetical protein